MGGWKTKILEEDSDAEFDEKNIFSARHSGCGAWVKAKEPYEVTRFWAHIKKCTDEYKKWRPAAGTPSLLKLGWSKGKTSATSARANSGSYSAKAPLKESYPCPGLTELDDSRIPVYLKRTGFIGSGA